MKNLKLYFIATVASMVLALISINAADASKSTVKPNIVFVLTDDQRWDAGGFAIDGRLDH